MVKMGASLNVRPLAGESIGDVRRKLVLSSKCILNTQSMVVLPTRSVSDQFNFHEVNVWKDLNFLQTDPEIVDLIKFWLHSRTKSRFPIESYCLSE